MEHRKNRHFWLKLAIASVSYGTVVSLAVLLWWQHMAPGMTFDSNSMAWLIVMAAGSVIAWGVAPGVAALLSLGSLYRMNFFLELWHGREKPYDMGARSFAMAIPVVSGIMSSVWQIVGGEAFELGHAATAVGGSVICAMLVIDSIVLGERKLVERRMDQAGAEGGCA